LLPAGFVASLADGGGAMGSGGGRITAGATLLQHELAPRVPLAEPLPPAAPRPAPPARRGGFEPRGGGSGAALGNVCGSNESRMPSTSGL
jgi:hypothetical protein